MACQLVSGEGTGDFTIHLSKKEGTISDSRRRSHYTSNDGAPSFKPATSLGNCVPRLVKIYKPAASSDPETWLSRSETKIGRRRPKVGPWFFAARRQTLTQGPSFAGTWEE